MIEVEAAPRFGTDPRSESESDTIIYILSGEFEFVIGGLAKIARTGETIEIPMNTVHSYRNLLDGKGRMLAILTPSGSGRFFVEGADLSGLPESAFEAGPNATFE